MNTKACSLSFFVKATREEWTLEQQKEAIRTQSSLEGMELQADEPKERGTAQTAPENGRPAKLFAPVYDDDFDGPDPSEIKVFRVDRTKKVSNFVFILVILLMAVVFPLMIFLNLLSARQAGGETVGQLLELARIFLS